MKKVLLKSLICKKTLVFLFLFSFNFVGAQEFSFDRSLKIGDSGQDVLILQKLLNQDPKTKIAFSGVGSPGQETNYFGNLTHQAVIKFQNKYRNQVLTPVNLVYGTGFFGSSTRSFINSGGNSNFSTINSNIFNFGNGNVSASLPKITSIYPNSGDGKGKITLTGTGYSDNNTVFVAYESSDKYTEIRSKNNGTEIVFDLDMKINLDFKKLEEDVGDEKYKNFQNFFTEVPIYIRIKNSRGESNIVKYYLKP